MDINNIIAEEGCSCGKKHITSIDALGSRQWGNFPRAGLCKEI